MATGSSRFTHVSLGSLEEKINLNPRQLELLKQRRARLDGQAEKKILPAKPSFVKNKKLPEATSEWDLQKTGTAPTASFGSSASEASNGAASLGSTVLSNPKANSYGQSLPTKERRKLYDDMGESYYEGSETSAPTVISSERNFKLPGSHRQDVSLSMSRSHESTPSQASSMKESAHGGKRTLDMKAHLKKRLLANMAEKRKGLPSLAPSNESRRESVGLRGPKTKGGLPDDHQRAFLRNLMKSAYSSKEEATVSVEMEQQADDKSSVTGSSTSRASSSTSAKDKAIMRKVLERNRKKRSSSDKSLVRSTSAKVIKTLSPKSLSSSGESESLGRSFANGSRRLFGRSKKSKSPRTKKNRWATNGNGSSADDEAESSDASVKIDPHHQKSTQPDSPVKDSPSQDISISKLEIPHPKTMLTGETSRVEGEKKVLSIEAPTTVHVKSQMTEVSALSRRSSFNHDKTPPNQSKEDMQFDEEVVSGRHSIMSRPSMIHYDSIEVEVAESKHARAVTESLMEPVDLTSPILNAAGSFKSPLASVKSAPPKTQPDSEELGTLEEEDPEGYAEFVATLRAEVAGSHSLLWESFHGLLNEDEKVSNLSTDGGHCQFDEKTKTMVTKMSSYLKKNHQVCCVTGTQLANDKTVRLKPIVKKPNFAPRYVETASNYDSDKENDRAIKPVSSTDSINEDTDNNEIEVTLGQFVRKSMSAPTSKSAPLKTSSSTKSLKSAMKPGTFTPRSNDRDSSTPWSGVKLRSVNDANKSEITNDSIPTSWAKVKLRPVSAKNEPAKSLDDTIGKDGASTNVADDESDFRRIIVSKKKEGAKETPKAARATNEAEVIEIIDLAELSSTAGQPIDLTTSDDPIDLTDKTNEDKPIDLTAMQTPRTSASQSHTGTKATAITADGSMLVSLAPEPNSEPVKVLIGKRGIVKIRTKSGETKARVIWRHELEDVRSAMLDLSSSKVKLLLHSSDDHKDLAFASPDACMRFANALHEQTTLKADEDNKDAETEAISVEESLYVEQLNEEEQRVLEEFRQSKKQDPTEVTLGQIDTSHEKPMSEINANLSGPNSPMSEISGPGTALSHADMEAARSYQKMLKLKIPKEAVRHKMEKDGVCSKVIDMVLGVDTTSSDASKKGAEMNASGLTPQEEIVAAGYRKMLKMRIPQEAVRHKMEKESVDPKIIAVVLGEESPTPDPIEAIPCKAADTSSLSTADESIAAPYRKMLKMMIPKDAVEHKMKKEQVATHIIAAVVGKPAGVKDVSKPGTPTLTDAEESVASAYRKMLSLRIPKEAVRQKMETEGISKKIIASVLKEKLTEDNKKGVQKRGGKQGFHWKPLEDNENLQNSVWSKATFDSSLLEDDVTIASHVEQFQKKLETDEKSRPKTKTNTDTSKEKAKLIDLSRANNIAITLKAFGDFSHAELAQAIEFVDPFEKIKGDRALFMKDLLPAAAEIKVIKSYKGDESRLVPAENWFKKIVHIKRIDEKILALRTMESFRNEAVALGESFHQLTTVCHQVMSSEKLPDLLEMVRQIGNRMNNDKGQEAAGFKLDFLPRLAQTKGSDKKTTALDLVVMIFHTRNRREALVLSDDFPGCYDASRLQVGELVTDTKMLGGAMRKCQKELDNLVSEYGLPPRKRAFVGDSHSESGAIEPPKQKDSNSVKTDISNMHEELFAKRNKLINTALDKHETQQSRTTSPRAAFLAAIANPNEKSYTYQGAINRINRFLDEAKIIYSELEAKREQALAACRELSEFFCEAGGERNAPTLLAILAEFAGNLSKSVAKYDHQQRMDARKKASKDKAATAPLDPHSSKTDDKKGDKNWRKAAQAEKKSLVLMVNEMLKVAGDKQREDFINGVVYERPDSRLKQIYEAEKKIGRPIGSPNTRKNILRTIEERRAAEDSQAALSELAKAMQKRTFSTDSHSPTAGVSLASQSFASCDESFAMTEASDEISNDVTTKKKANQMSIVDRWTRKVDDETVTEELKFDIEATEDRTLEEKKRQQYIGRWASQKDNSLLGSHDSGRDLDAESDVDALLEYHSSQKRQKYINRWASKPDSKEEEVESLSLDP